MTHIAMLSVGQEDRGQPFVATYRIELDGSYHRRLGEEIARLSGVASLSGNSNMVLSTFGIDDGKIKLTYWSFSHRGTFTLLARDIGELDFVISIKQLS